MFFFSRSFVIFLILIAFIPFGIDYLTRHEFVVHDRGVIVISGTSTGIGKDAAFQLARRGYTIVAGVRSEKSGAAILNEGKARGIPSERLIPFILDVTRQEDIEKVFEYTSGLVKSSLPLVGVINNAGIAAYQPVESFDLYTARETFEVNFWGAFILTQKFLPLLRQYKGRVLFVSSVAGITSIQGSSIYSATKRSIEAMADSLRLEVQNRFGISVSSILPGYIKTEIGGKSESYVNNVTAAQRELYSGYWERVLTKKFNNHGHVNLTSNAILDAITNPFPRTRYYAGPCTEQFDANHVSILAGILPDRVGDLFKVSN